MRVHARRLDSFHPAVYPDGPVERTNRTPATVLFHFSERVDKYKGDTDYSGD